MRRLIFILLCIIPIALYSSGIKKWKKTASGIYYKIYTSDTFKPKPVYGDHLWMHLRKFSPGKKEVFNTKIFDAGKGVEVDYKKSSKETDVTEIFSLMGRGDSALVKVPTILLDSNGSKKKYYTFHLNLVDFKTKAVYEDEKNKQYNMQISIDSVTIADYLNNHNLLDAQKDIYGNHFLILKKGTASQVKEGDSIDIHYIGKLSDGNEFDNSYNRNRKLSFVVGNNQVIEGMDRGVLQFHYGDKGILIIPSRHAYRDKEIGKIPPNSVLIFELEITLE